MASTLHCPLSFKPCLNYSLSNKRLSSLCFRPSNNVVNAAAKPIKPLNCLVPPRSQPDMEVQDGDNQPLEETVKLGFFNGISIVGFFESKGAEFWKSIDDWVKKTKMLQLIATSVAFGCLIWFQRDKMLSLLQSLHPMIEYLNTNAPAMRFLFSMAAEAGVWSWLINNYISPQLPPQIVVNVEKQAETAHHKSQNQEVKVDVKVKVGVHGNNQLLQKTFTATIKVPEQETMEARDTESNNTAEDGKNQPLEDQNGVAYIDNPSKYGTSSVGFLVSRGAELWKSIEGWLPLIATTVGFGCLIWFQRDKMLPLLQYLHPVIEYLNTNGPAIRLLFSMAADAGFWNYKKNKISPQQLTPPNVEKQVEDVKTAHDKSQAQEAEVEVEVEVHIKVKVRDGNNKLIEKKSLETIAPGQEEPQESAESEKNIDIESNDTAE